MANITCSDCGSSYGYPHKDGCSWIKYLGQPECSSCHHRPAGHGHFALYCEPCSQLPYGVVAPA